MKDCHHRSNEVYSIFTIPSLLVTTLQWTEFWKKRSVYMKLVIIYLLVSEMIMVLAWCTFFITFPLLSFGRALVYTCFYFKIANRRKYKNRSKWKIFSDRSQILSDKPKQFSLIQIHWFLDNLVEISTFVKNVYFMLPILHL